MVKTLLRIISALLLVFVFCSSGNQKSGTPVFQSGITSIKTDERTINDLVLLGQVWGFVKYYHPAVVEGNFDMDQELFRFLPVYLSNTGTARRNSSLCQWVNHFGKIRKKEEHNADSALIKMKADFSWARPQEIGDSLCSLVREIRFAKRGKKNFYAQTDMVSRVSFSNEKEYRNSKLSDPGIRLLTVYRYWNVIQYFFPYKYAIGRDWNETLHEFIPSLLNAHTELAYRQELMRMSVQIHDSHSAFSADSTLKGWYGRYKPEIILRYVEKQFVVAIIDDNLLAKQCKLRPGDIILSVNGEPVDSIANRRRPFTPGSNETSVYRNIALELLRSNDSLEKITWRRGTQVLSGTVSCIAIELVSPVRVFQRKDTCFRYLSPDLAYIYPGSIRNKYLDDVMPGFMKTKAMIIDLRCYPKEFIPFTLGKYLWQDQSTFVHFTAADIRYPGDFVFAKSFDGQGRKNENCYKGKVVILVNEFTQSQAEYTAMAFRHVPGSVVIGSTTAGADGDVTRIVLPGAFFASFSGLGIYYPDGGETQRSGIVPDIFVTPTIDGIAAQKDEVLERAVNLANGK